MFFSSSKAISTFTYTPSSNFSASILSERENIFISTTVCQLNNHFTKIESIYSPSTNEYYDMDYSSHSNFVLLFGGRNNSLSVTQDCRKFEIQSKQWSSVGQPLPPKRYGHCVRNIGGERFFIFGGQDENNNYCNNTYIYDVSVPAYTEVATSTSPQKRGFFSSCYVPEENKVYIFGGQGSEGGSGVYFNDLWYFDVRESSWVCVVSSCNVSKLSHHKMVYVPSNKEMYIFGGTIEGSNMNFSSAVWKYNLTGSSFSFVCYAPFKGIQDFGMAYIPEIEKILFLFGEQSSNTSQDFYFYDVAMASFTKNIQPYLNPPPPRSRFEMVSISSFIFLYGGYDKYREGGKYYNDTYEYYYSTSGYFIIRYFYPPEGQQTSFSYRKITISPTQLPGTEIKIQIATTTITGNTGLFVGPSFDPTKYFYPGDEINISTFNNTSISIKCFLSTTKPPNNPYFENLNIMYNYRPYKPILTFPENGFSTNTVRPMFCWTAGSDPDKEETYFSYRLQISASESFSPLIIDKESISTNTYTLTQDLSHGRYYWRVATKDLYDYSEFSNSYAIEIDTVPPSIPYLKYTQTGDENGEVDLYFEISGDDGNKGNFYGSVVVAYSSWTDFLEAEFDNFPFSEIFVVDKNNRKLPSEEISVSVKNLLNNTTYYFRIKLKDEAGNVSDVSTYSVCGITNFTPKVNFVLPLTGQELTKTVTIQWEYSDFNSSDTHKFSLYYLREGNAYYIPIIENLPNGTTQYLWDTFSVKNGSYSIKVVCSDNVGWRKEGLESEDFIYNLKINNENKPPIVNWIFPTKDVVLMGKVTIYWDIYDQNLQDTHTYRLYITTSTNFTLLDEILYDTTRYIFDTTKWQNSPYYRLRLFVTDGELSDQKDSEVFAIKNDNLPPSQPVLLLPPNNSYTSPFKIKFKWQHSTDPNIGDVVVYDLYVSTEPSMLNYFLRIMSITSNEFEVFYPTITERRTYYWCVKARDLFSEAAQSQVFRFTTYPRNRTVSEDYKVYVELIEGLDEQVFVYVEKFCDEKRQSQMISLADSKDRYNRLIKIIPYEVYRVVLYNSDLQEINKDIKFKLAFAVDSQGYGFPIENLRISRLDTTRNCWVFPEYKQQMEKTKSYNLSKECNVVAYSNKCGLFSVVGKNTIEEPLSEVKIYPNPCNTLLEPVKIEYVLTEDNDVKLQILTLSGSLVKEFFYPAGMEGKSRGLPEGEINEILWDGKNDKGMLVANGMYLCRIIAGGKSVVRYIGVVKK